jgi:hypothetical protein
MMRTAFWAFALGILSVPAISDAALTVSLQPSSQTFLYNTNVSGFLDVFVTGTGGDNVSSFGIGTDIVYPAGGSGVTINTSNPVTNATSAPNGYLFDTRGLLLPFAVTETRVEYLDGFLTNTNFKTVNSGETYGAGRIFFEIAAGAAPGTYTFDFDESVSQFRGPAPGTALIPATFVNGSITILPAGVPEPSTTVLLGLTGVVGFGVSRLRKRRHASATTSA